MQGRFVFAAGMVSFAALVALLFDTDTQSPTRAPMASVAPMSQPDTATSSLLAAAAPLRSACERTVPTWSSASLPMPTVSEDLRLFLEGANPDDEVDVIVSVRGDADLGAWAEQMNARGLGHVRVLAGLRAVAVRLPAHAIHELLLQRELEHLTRDAPMAASLDAVTQVTGADQVLADSGLDGTGIVIAVIDSGVAHHVALDGHILQELDCRSGVTPDVRDLHGHGTHVAGVMVGAGVLTASGERRMRGIAPGAKIISLKALGEDGLGKTSDVIAAVEWVAEHARNANGAQVIHVLNLSAGHPIFESYQTDPLVLACRHAVDAGVVVVTSVGNYGTGQGLTLYGGITSPANAPWVIAVGASDGRGTVTRNDDLVAPFSSAGPTVIDGLYKPDVVAPGVSVTSTIPRTSVLALANAAALVSPMQLGAPGPMMPGSEGHYLSLSGTSAAAPVVAGTVALMLQANPQLTPHTLRAILQYSAQKLREPHLLQQGAGLVNAEGAVRLARAITPTVASGQVWLLGALMPASTIGGSQAYFGCSLLCGDGVVFGESVLAASAPVLSPLWGNGIVYEQSLSYAQSGVWADALVTVRQAAYRAQATAWSGGDWQSGVVAPHVVWKASVEATWYPYLVNPLALMTDGNRLLAHSDSGDSIPMVTPGAWYYPAHP